jgi:hypothetical protein
LRANEYDTAVQSAAIAAPPLIAIRMTLMPR